MSQPRSHFPMVAVFAAASFFLSAQASQGQTRDDIHILWIGNSFTYVNELPTMVAALAKARKQHTLIHEEQTKGGATLEVHWEDKDHKALKKIRSHKWDLVVLSDQHRECLKPSSKMAEYAQKFDAEIRKQGGKTLLYLPWPPEDLPENQAKLAKLHQSIAKDIKATVVPAGIAWEKIITEGKLPKLYKEDKAHPTKAGTYLTACVFYATIYGKSPKGLPGKIGGLSDDDAKHFQEIAWQVVKDQSKKE